MLYNRKLISVYTRYECLYTTVMVALNIYIGPHYFVALFNQMFKKCFVWNWNTTNLPVFLILLWQWKMREQDTEQTDQGQGVRQEDSEDSQSLCILKLESSSPMGLQKCVLFPCMWSYICVLRARACVRVPAWAAGGWKCQGRFLIPVRHWMEVYICGSRPDSTGRVTATLRLRHVLAAVTAAKVPL